jgi:hypothetical protein
MTLELSKVTRQVEDLGQVLALGARRRQKALPALRGLLHAFADDWERLAALADSPVGQDARCAGPTSEPLDAVFPAPNLPSRATIVAADGSEIRPDAHSLAFYYLINVGSLVYRHGTGLAPVAASDPRIAHAVDATGSPLPQEVLTARRDVAEIEKLADLAEAEPSDVPLVALLDSTLALRAWSSAIPAAEQEALRAAYRAQMDRLRLASAALTGFVSRSQQAGVVNLLDRALWGDLEPGQRSALFRQPGAQPAYFFYLNTEPLDWQPAPGTEAEPARIEVPDWVAMNPEKLSRVHAVVYDQCCINNGYPYALTRADELAIILNEEREALETMILRAMSRQGMPLPRISLKAAQKRVARAPSRRRL